MVVGIIIILTVVWAIGCLIYNYTKFKREND